MENKLVIAAAGAGKTTYLVDQALKIQDGRVLITTFTNANEREIRKKFYERNGCVPERVTVQTWFSFLLQHGVRPYQSVVYNGKINGVLFKNEEKQRKRYIKKTNPLYYINGKRLIYNDKISEFVYEVNSEAKNSGRILKRLARIYSHIFIDEVQDMAGYDLEFIKALLASPVNLLMVGDPRQTTYQTNNANKNKRYSGGKIAEFIREKCQGSETIIDDTTLNVTYRNNEAICALANQVYRGKYAACLSLAQKSTGHDGVFWLTPGDVDAYLEQYSPMQLRYNQKSTVNPQYAAMNFGDAKGLAFDRVLIYPTKAMENWLIKRDILLEPQTKAKLYVAITRARYSVAFVVKKKAKKIDDARRWLWERELTYCQRSFFDVFDFET